MIKKWIALCLGALLLVAVFSGCGTGETPSGSQGSSPQGEPAAEGEIVTREDGSISFTDLSGRAITLEKQRDHRRGQLLGQLHAGGRGPELG